MFDLLMNTVNRADWALAGHLIAHRFHGLGESLKHLA